MEVRSEPPLVIPCARTEKIGICIKDATLTVLSQNELCRAACGITIGQRCEASCIQAARSKAAASSAGAKQLTAREDQAFNGVVLTDGDRYDLLLLNDQTHITTLLWKADPDRITLWNEIEASSPTARETEIATWVLRGMSNADIACRLAISAGTVRTHLNNLYRKLSPTAVARLQRCRTTSE